MQMCAAHGRAQMKLKLSKSGNLVHTMKYYLDCDSDPQADGTASESDIPAIIEAATRAEAAASDAASKALISEGYAKGTQNGQAVPSSSPYYHNNAEWFKDNMTTLGGLSDTTISSPANGQMLYYDASAGKWKNGGVLIKTTDPGEGSTLGTGALLAVVE